MAQKRSRPLVGDSFHHLHDEPTDFHLGAHARLYEHFVEGMMDNVGLYGTESPLERAEYAAEDVAGESLDQRVEALSFSLYR